MVRSLPIFQSDSAAPFAAVDLGSNSFHLIVAYDQDGRLQVVDRHKEMVRLAEGLSASGTLSADAAARALACLKRLAQRIRHLPHENIRIVGTNTLRKARDSQDFIERAETALGHRIEVISGREEARLIYLGVSHSLEDNYDTRLVVDIGGGSTELILGRQFQPRLLESLHMGCVAMSAEHFPNGRIRTGGMTDAENAARQELEVIEHVYRAHGWDTVIGASGTIMAIQDADSGTVRRARHHCQRHRRGATTTGGRRARGCPRPGVAERRATTGVPRWRRHSGSHIRCLGDRAHDRLGRSVA